MSSALDLLASLRLEDGRRWGEVAAPFQWADAKAVLAPGSETPYHFLTRARGGSKTSDLAAVAVAAMLTQLPGRSRAYALAADKDQGRLLVDSVAGFAARTPELRGALRVDSYRVTATRGGAVLDVLAADAPSAWGLRPSFLVVDEIAAWASTPGARRIFEAATSAAAKIAGCRMVLLTTAGSPSHWSAKVLEHARRDPLWRVHEVAGPPPWIDRARLAEQRRRLPESSYRRLFENEWIAAEDSLASPSDLAACVTLDGPLPPESGRIYVVGLDLGLKRDRTVAAVCHAERIERVPEGQVVPYIAGTRVVLDRIETWQGSRDRPVSLADVETWVAQASKAYGHALVVGDPWQALGSFERLRARGVHVVEFTFSSASVGRLASTLHLAIRNRSLALPPDEELLDELANVRLEETPAGLVRLAHDADRHDDRAIAIALAAQHLLGQPQPAERASVGGSTSRYLTGLDASVVRTGRFSDLTLNSRF